MADFAIIPAHEEDDAIELAKTKTGAIFRKKILHYGTIIHPKTGKKVAITREIGEQMKKNFDSGAGVDMVQAVVATDENAHSQNPELSRGEVVDIEVAKDGIYTIMDIRDKDTAEKMRKKTIRGSSASINMSGVDTTTGKLVGPVLVHNCITNNPWVKGLGDYEEILNMSDAFDSENDTVHLFEFIDDSKDETALSNEPHDNETVVLSQEPDVKENITMTKDELIAALKKDHGIDVVALEATVDEASNTASLANQVVSALTDSGILSLSNTDSADKDQVLGAVVELAKDHVELSNTVKSLQLSAAETHVKALVGKGYLLPKQEKVMTNLFLTSREDFDALLPEEPVVAIESELGLTAVETESKELDVEAAKAYYDSFISSKK